MLGFLARRIVSSCIVLFVVASLTFVGLRLLPGGPFDGEATFSPVVQQNLQNKYGLDRPLLAQYGLYIGGLLRGDWGRSFQYNGRPVLHVIGEALPVSLTLGGLALLMAFFLGVSLGAWSGFHQGTWRDRSLTMLAMAGVSVPSFLMGPLLLGVFSFGWPLLIFQGELLQFFKAHSLLLPSGLWLGPRYWVLPVLTLAIRPTAFLFRLTRASVADFRSKDFVRTAKSKGLGETQVLFTHVLKNSLAPILAYGGPLVAGLLTGSFVVEIIFAVPGIAKYFVQSVFYRDYPMVMALTLIFAGLLVFSNLLMDLIFRWVDPAQTEESS